MHCQALECQSGGEKWYLSLVSILISHEYNCASFICLWGMVMYFLGMVHVFCPVQFSRSELCPTLCDSMDCNTPGFPVHHQLPKLTQTHIHWASDSIQSSHPLSSPSPPIFNLSQHQGLFKWVSSSHQVAKVLEFQLQHQFFQWIFKTHFL